MDNIFLYSEITSDTIVQNANRVIDLYKQQSFNFHDAGAQMYNFIQKKGWYSLLNLDDTQLEPVGIAFSIIALHSYSADGNYDINLVSAENAAYCLSRLYFNTQNKKVLPALICLLQKEKLLKDALIGVRIKIVNTYMMPLHMYYDVPFIDCDPYRSPYYKKLWAEASEYGTNIRYFILNEIYNIDSKEWIIDTNNLILCPSESDLVASIPFKIVISENEEDKKIYKENGKELMRKMYEVCEHTLRRF